MVDLSLRPALQLLQALKVVTLEFFIHKMPSSFSNSKESAVCLFMSDACRFSWAAIRPVVTELLDPLFCCSFMWSETEY